MKYFIAVPSLIVLTVVVLAAGARAEDNVFELRFENRRFTPQSITVPANKPFRIKIINASKEAMEFESFKLNREKVAGPGETIIVNAPALSPGNYDFYDDFHQDVPEGSIIAK
jgi:cupredoxin-like protein